MRFWTAWSDHYQMVPIWFAFWIAVDQSFHYPIPINRQILGHLLRWSNNHFERKRNLCGNRSSCRCQTIHPHGHHSCRVWSKKQNQIPTRNQHRNHHVWLPNRIGTWIWFIGDVKREVSHPTPNQTAATVISHGSIFCPSTWLNMSEKQSWISRTKAVLSASCRALKKCMSCSAMWQSSVWITKGGRSYQVFVLLFIMVWNIELYTWHHFFHARL